MARGDAARERLAGRKPSFELGPFEPERAFLGPRKNGRLWREEERGDDQRHGDRWNNLGKANSGSTISRSKDAGPAWFKGLSPNYLPLYSTPSACLPKTTRRRDGTSNGRYPSRRPSICLGAAVILATGLVLGAGSHVNSQPRGALGPPGLGIADGPQLMFISALQTFTDFHKYAQVKTTYFGFHRPICASLDVLWAPHCGTVRSELPLPEGNSLELYNREAVDSQEDPLAQIRRYLGIYVKKFQSICRTIFGVYVGLDQAFAKQQDVQLLNWIHSLFKPSLIDKKITHEPRDLPETSGLGRNGDTFPQYLVGVSAVERVLDCAVDSAVGMYLPWAFQHTIWIFNPEIIDQGTAPFSANLPDSKPTSCSSSTQNRSRFRTRRTARVPPGS
ncbi:hypothetical protein C8R43DRAFT_943785 [Mycena crocata]|nr:hypothetical protein C8R43DRAFT_943785 [Mycena crocata]